MALRIDVHQAPEFRRFDKAGEHDVKPDGYFTYTDIPHLSDKELDMLAAVASRSNMGKEDAEKIIKIIKIMKLLRSSELSDEFKSIVDEKQR